MHLFYIDKSGRQANRCSFLGESCVSQILSIFVYAVLRYSAPAGQNRQNKGKHAVYFCDNTFWE